MVTCLRNLGEDDNGEQCNYTFIWYKSTRTVLIQGGNETKVKKQIEFMTSQVDEHQQKPLDSNDSKVWDKLLKNTSPALSSERPEVLTDPAQVESVSSEIDIISCFTK